MLLRALPTGSRILGSGGGWRDGVNSVGNYVCLLCRGGRVMLGCDGLAIAEGLYKGRWGVGGLVIVQVLVLYARKQSTNQRIYTKQPA